MAGKALKDYRPQRILIIRFHRLGDVILSTPVIQELRQVYSDAFIAMMVRPPCQEALEGNPYLDEVLIYDKEGRQHSALDTLSFAAALRRKHFDTAVILHPSNRSHWIPFLAGIPHRIGFNKKQPWLLTRAIAHDKQEGERHEAEYTLELLQALGISASAPKPLMVVSPHAAARVEALLSQASVGPKDLIVAIHPSASCVSKRWMPERFAAVADKLAKERGVRICLVAGKEDAPIANEVASAMREQPVNLAGELTISELAALMQRARLLISNDSGPVHVAAAVGTPVVDIFGRNQKGLSPKRWGPIGKGHQVLHKEVGCITCLAHLCDIQFQCLTALTVDEVYLAAVRALGA